jgi:hypothetical protein
MQNSLSRTYQFFQRVIQNLRRMKLGELKCHLRKPQLRMGMAWQVFYLKRQWCPLL